MKHEFLDRPDYGMAVVTFESPGERIVVEAGAMVARDTGVQMETNMRGGRSSLCGRSWVGNRFS